VVSEAAPSAVMASGPPASPLCGGEQRGYAMAHDLIADMFVGRIN